MSFYWGLAICRVVYGSENRAGDKIETLPEAEPGFTEAWS